MNICQHHGLWSIDFHISTGSKKCWWGPLVYCCWWVLLATWFCCSRGHHQSTTNYFSILWCSWISSNQPLSYWACYKCSTLLHKTPYQHSNPKSSPLKLLSNLKLQLQHLHHLQNPSPHHPNLSPKYCSTGKSQSKGSGHLYKKNGHQNMNTLCLCERGGTWCTLNCALDCLTQTWYTLSYALDCLFRPGTLRYALVCLLRPGAPWDKRNWSAPLWNPNS